MKGMI